MYAYVPMCSSSNKFPQGLERVLLPAFTGLSMLPYVILAILMVSVRRSSVGAPTTRGPVPALVVWLYEHLKVSPSCSTMGQDRATFLIT